MGLLVDGKWLDRWYETGKHGGRFIRESARFRNWITVDGSPGPTGGGGFPAEPGRYHLYVSHACPWCHRTVVFRTLKGLEDTVSMSSVAPHMLEHGWEFARLAARKTADPVNGRRYLHEIYTLADPDYTGRVTVPLLWDREQKTIVNNESADIIRMFNSAFREFTHNDTDYYPPSLQQEIDHLNEVIYHRINNGVYRCGFATSQEAYEEAFAELFEELERIEARLSRNRYLLGPAITEADWRLFPTLIRFDAVYCSHFKCNLRRIADYPNLAGYTRDLFQQPGVADTVRLDEIKQHYYYSHASINPARIVPCGPELDFSAPHDRARLS